MTSRLGVVVRFATFGGASSLSRPAVILASRLVSSLAPPNCTTTRLGRHSLRRALQPNQDTTSAFSLLPVLRGLEYNGYCQAISTLGLHDSPAFVEMNNFSVALRSLIIFGVCVVLAIWLGYLLANPLTYSSLALYGSLAFILAFPVFLRWHFPLLLLCWNMAAVVFFLPGHPGVCLPMIMMSLGISMLQRMISKEHPFIYVPQVTLPLLCLLAVIFFTARMTGMGMRSLGSEVYGGHKYAALVVGILGYFALSARRTPPARKNLYLGLFYLGGATAIIGDLVPLLPHSMYFIFWVFPPNLGFFAEGGPNSVATRLDGARTMSLLIFSFMLARHGIRGIFLSHKTLRCLVFLSFFTFGLFGGFRGYILGCGLVFGLQFFLERLYRTKLMAVLLSLGIVGALVLIPLASHLPYTFQRAISFMPYKVNAEARSDAQASWEWRVQMWQALLPQIPQYLIVGKGYNISQVDYNFVMGPEASVRNTFAQNQALALAEDFHSGPISVVIPFGIWGCIVFLWFMAAGLWVVYHNYRYGDPALQIVNTFLLASFAAQVIYFLFVFGDLAGDMLKFTGLLGLSVSFNGGVRRRVHTIRSIPAKQKTGGFARLPSAPVPAFQRQRPGTFR